MLCSFEQYGRYNQPSARAHKYARKNVQQYNLPAEQYSYPEDGQYAQPNTHYPSDATQ